MELLCNNKLSCLKPPNHTSMQECVHQMDFKVKMAQLHKCVGTATERMENQHPFIQMCMKITKWKTPTAEKGNSCNHPWKLCSHNRK